MSKHRSTHNYAHRSGESKSQSGGMGGCDDSIFLMGFASDVQSEDCDGQKVLLKAN